MQRTQYSGFAAKPLALFFAGMDRDGDHLVHEEEFKFFLNEEWLLLSTDGHPGALQYAKWSKSALGAPDALPSFVSFDSNLNGSLSKVEFSDFLSRQFVVLDKNSDGFLDRSELLFRVEASRGGGANRSSGRSRQSGGRDGGNRPPR